MKEPRGFYSTFVPLAVALAGTLLASSVAAQMPTPIDPFLDTPRGLRVKSDGASPGYVLFNPGIGHPNLAKGWIPTLRYVINTRRPVLITAHSRLDTERDWSVLKATLLDLGQDERLQRCCGHSDDDGEQNPYRLNPFASRLDYEDPCCEAAGLHLGNGKEDGSNHMYVRPNMFSLLLH